MNYFFAVVAHVDHGKTSFCNKLASYFYDNFDILDNLSVEQERGITVKIKPFSFDYYGRKYFLIDTPGHVEFFQQVENTLQIVDNVFLIIDIKKGIQAQTFRLLEIILKKKLNLIVVYNKIDLYSDYDISDIEKYLNDLNFFYHDAKVSCKTGQGFDKILSLLKTSLISSEQFNSVLFDAYFSNFGQYFFAKTSIDLKIGQNIFLSSGQKVKIFNLFRVTNKLERLSFIKAPSVALIMVKTKLSSIVLGNFYTNYKTFKHCSEYNNRQISYLFFDIFNSDQSNFDFDKILLLDSTIQLKRVSNKIFGAGCRISVRGLIHKEVLLQRLKDEMNFIPIVSYPSFIYRYYDKHLSKYIYIENLKDGFNISSFIKHLEGIIYSMKLKVLIILMDKILSFLASKNIFYTVVNDEKNAELTFNISLANLNAKFMDNLKVITNGNFILEKVNEHWGILNIGLLEILVNNEKIDYFDRLLEHELALEEGSNIVNAILENLETRNFKLKVQASFNKKIIYSKTLAAFYNDVASHCYGGDITRKNKLRTNQSKSRKIMQKNFKLKLNYKTLKNIFNSLKNKNS